MQKPRVKTASFSMVPKANAEAKSGSVSGVWTPQSRRTGLIAIKKGMSVVWDEFGIRVPVTVLQVQDNQVITNIYTPRGTNKSPYRAVQVCYGLEPFSSLSVLVLTPRNPNEYVLQVGAVNINSSKTHIGMRGHFRKAGVPCKEWVHEFEVSEDAHLPVGENNFLYNWRSIERRLTRVDLQA